MKNIIKNDKLNFDFYKLSYESKLEKQLEKLPKKVEFCKKCVVSNQRPRITFDQNGVCSACNWFEEKKNLFATQFHPEKSGEVGLKVYNNFVNTI